MIKRITFSLDGSSGYSPAYENDKKDFLKELKRLRKKIKTASIVVKYFDKHNDTTYTVGGIKLVLKAYFQDEAITITRVRTSSVYLVSSELLTIEIEDKNYSLKNDIDA